MTIRNLTFVSGGALVGVLMATNAMAQTAPSLGNAQSFGVLGGSTVTNTGATVVTGHVGVSPGSALTGFPPGIVVAGTPHVADALAAQAQADALIAYNSLGSQTCTSDLTGQDLGGKTLVAGVYCFSTSGQLTGTLTLDAAGDPSAVFIFRMGSTLTTASSANVLMLNNGQACNVFWQVGSSATLGTNTRFAGNILAVQSITLTTGAGVAGRVIARVGAVTLDTNLVGGCAAAAPSCPAITLAPPTVPNGTVGVAYAQTLTASGDTGPFTFGVTAGALPGGVSLAATGGLSGTPTTAASFFFAVRATAPDGCFQEGPYAIAIAAAPPVPTLGAWAMIILATVLFLGGVVMMRRRTSVS